MLRTRALAKVNRIAHEYVAPRLESAANSASTRLNNWRERETTSEPEPGAYTYQVRQPKKAAGPASSSSSSGLENWSTSAGAAPTLQNSDYPRPYAAGSSSSSRSIATSATTSSSERTTPSRKWTASGLGSYLHLGSYSGASTTGLDSTSGATLASSSGASTTTGSKGKGKATAAGGGLDDIDEDKILCFPGWATLQPSRNHDASEPALVLEIHAHGYAYRQRPLSQASRSQRIFYALAKSFAALPKIPPHVAAAAAVSVPSTPTSVTDGSEEDDDAQLGADAVVGKDDRRVQDGTAEGEALEKLLSVGGRAGDRAAEKEVLQEAASTTSSPPDDERLAPETSEEPDQMSLEEQLRSPTARDFATSQHPPPLKPARSATAPTPAPPPVRTSPTAEDEAAILSTPAKLSRRPGFRIEIPPSPASLANARRAVGSTSSSQPGSPTGGGASPLRSPGFRSAAFNFVKRDRHKTKTQDSSYNAASEFEPPGSSSKRSSAASSRASSRASSPVRGSHLRTTPHHLHHPRHRESPSVPLPPETWPSPFTLPSDPHALPRLHTNLHTRLLPFFGLKLANRKIRVSAYPALAEGQLYDGVLASTVVRTSATSGGGFKTCLEVRGPELRKWLDLVGNGSGGARGGGLDTLRVRVVAELLETDPLVPSVVDTAPFSGVGFGNSNKDAAAAHASAIATAVDEVELDVGIQGEGGEGGGVRIVSDVDDTIKWTEVTKGTKTIFRNVFVRELGEIRVPGMSSWYRSLQAHGAQFHYVSNSPIELWPVLRTFLKLAGFPNGSCSLKEYGGASSALAKLWEEPGQRKKANVETILKEFPAARFILVGDSGEQDLELYVALARQYPSNILAIYIRDVTTPFDPIAANPANRHQRKKQATPAAEPGATGGAPRRASADQVDSHTPPPPLPAREGSLPPKVTWKHTNSMNDLAGLIDDDALRFVAPNPHSHASRTASATTGDDTTRPALPERPLSDMPDLPGQWDGPHERPIELLRRSSDSAAPIPVPEPLMHSAAAAAHPAPTSPASKEHPPHRAATTPISTSPSPINESPLPSSPSLLSEPDSDPLSPNNPIRPAPGLSTPGLDPAVEAFYRRVAAAERSLPKGVILRLFRHGNECAEEALELVKTAGKRPFGT
ncbi:hypothetical protein RHOSPDRAFT_29924 [Rhodotorula sp. JG-1b]|nr:hypothetical protein RHOSPDRAFT_29924 [Rhodotorula sp. JG-1b]